MNLATLISTKITNGLRALQVLLGNAKTISVTRTPSECAPYGDDSCPIDNVVCVYSMTSNSNQPGIVYGYINNQQQAQPGEKRLYSTDSSGAPMAHVWIHNTGLICIKNVESGKDLYTLMYNVMTLLQNINNNVLLPPANITTPSGDGQLNPAFSTLLTDYNTQLTTYIDDLNNLLSAT